MHDGVSVDVDYPLPPRTVTGWFDPPCVIVVEALPTGVADDPYAGIHNAVVLNLDGSERLRLRPPAVATEPYRHIGFDQVLAGRDGLVAVYATRVGDYWGVPDLRTGELRGVRQWR